MPKKQSLEEFVDAVILEGRLDDDVSEKIRLRVFEEGVVKKSAADAVLKINKKIKDSDNTNSWRRVFVEILSSFVLADEESLGVIDDKESNYLISNVANNGSTSENGLALFVHILGAAAKVPEDFMKFTVDTLYAKVEKEGLVNKCRAEMLRKIFHYCKESRSFCKVMKETVEKISVVAKDKPNHPAWDEFLKIYTQKVSEY